MTSESSSSPRAKPARVPLALAWLLLTVLLIGLPFSGALLAGSSLLEYLEFPPLTRHVQHAPFSWAVFIALTAIGLGFLVAITAWYFPLVECRPAQKKGYPYPWWGWTATLFVAVFWILAWTRFEWYQPLQSWTFAFLWLSYIFAMNAMTHRRCGACLLTHEPCYFVALFPASATFWWYFEYLNRFVQNWYYSGIEDFSPSRYILHATFAFATVLPAVMSTMAFLKSFPRLRRDNTGIDGLAEPSRVGSLFILLLSSLGLMGISVWPDYLYPLIWILPILILESLLRLFGAEGPLMKIWNRQRDLLGLAMVSALVCGLFWEMWNYYSSPKWVYSIPYVHRFLIFEMPVLGYLGYLPFGLECLAVADLVRRMVAGNCGMLQSPQALTNR
jgi:hypothetical protein